MSDKEVYTITVKVKSKWAAQKVTNILHALMRLSAWGSSKWVFTDWDGDGSDKVVSVESPFEPVFTPDWSTNEAVGIWNGQIKPTSRKEFC